MVFRLSVPLALAAMLAALPAAAQQAVDAPAGTAAPAPEPAEPPYPGFYGTPGAAGESTGFAEPWYVREGADEPYDTDPRDSLSLPQPQPFFSFGLR